MLGWCAFGVTGWRGHIAGFAAAESERVGDPFSVNDAHRVRHDGGDAWARLVGDSVRRITVVNSSRLHAALIVEYFDAARDKGGLPAKELQAVVRELATFGTTLCFDTVEWSESRAVKATRSAELGG